MKTIEQITKQSDLIHTAAILGARYESKSAYEHTFHLPCGISVEVCWIHDLELVFGCPPHHHVGYAFTNPRALARKIQSYVWVISSKWDQQNHPETK